jgi:hypothetical protein
MIGVKDFESLFEELFADLKHDALMELSSRATSFSVLGNFRGVLSSRRVRQSFVDKFRSVVSVVYRAFGVNNQRMVDEHVNAAAVSMEQLVERVNLKIEDLAGTAATVGDLSAAVESFPEFGAASRWAETEYDSVRSMAQLISASAEGMTHKTWVSMEDERVRDSHVFMNGTKIQINALFQTPGGPGRAPRDPALPPEEKINCRCELVFSKE